MRRWFILFFIVISPTLWAQDYMDQLLITGIENAKVYGKAYMDPGSKALLFTLSKGWYHSAKVKKRGSLDLSLKMSNSFVSEKDQSFTIDPKSFDFLTPLISSGEVEAATILGNNSPGIHMLAKYKGNDQQYHETEIILPQGLGHSSVNFLPAGFVEAAVGTGIGTEIKFRFLPKIKLKGVSTSLYGAAIQHEITHWLSPSSNFPLHIAALAGVTFFDGRYHLPPRRSLEGEDQSVKAHSTSWIITSLFSTDFKILNFYAGAGYMFGKTDTALKGNFQATLPHAQLNLTDPYSITNRNDGLTATLGTNLQLGRFQFYIDYNLQRFAGFSGGMSLKII